MLKWCWCWYVILHKTTFFVNGYMRYRSVLVALTGIFLYCDVAIDCSVLPYSGSSGIIYPTREPIARWSLAAGNKLIQKVAPYLTRTRALFFALYVSNKSYYCAKHNHKLNQIRICNHWHQLPSLVSGNWHIAPSAPWVSILYFHGALWFSWDKENRDWCKLHWCNSDLSTLRFIFFRLVHLYHC